jgi:chemotaxis protein MotA
MGKYPPAMGLMGAVMGMIALLASLGKPGAEKGIGVAMSVALVATLYGIAMANLFVIPVGENLAVGAKQIKTKNLIIIEGVRLIAQRTNPIVLAEELNSFLLPGERIDWKKAG